MGFLRPSDYENLPDDDHDAFVALEAIARARLHETETDQYENLSHYETMRYMNEITALAEHFGLSGITYNEDNENHFDEYAKFTRKVEYQAAQIMVRVARRNRKNSVEITGADRMRIQHQVSRLRDEVENSAIPASRKRALLDRIADFEAELAKQRFDYLKAAMVAALVTAAANDFVGTLKDAPEVIQSITKVLTEADMTGLEYRMSLPPTTPVRALPDLRATRSPVPEKPFDDDVPF